MDNDLTDDLAQLMAATAPGRVIEQASPNLPEADQNSPSDLNSDLSQSQTQDDQEPADHDLGMLLSPPAAALDQHLETSSEVLSEPLMPLQSAQLAELELEMPQYRSPVLMRLDPSVKQPVTQCTTCKGAVWMRVGTGLRSWCRVMHQVSWETSEPVQIEDCDGPSMMER